MSSASKDSPCIFCLTCGFYVTDPVASRRHLTLLERYLKVKLVVSNVDFQFCNDCIAILESVSNLYDEIKRLEYKAEWEVRKLKDVIEAENRVPAYKVKEGRIPLAEAMHTWRRHVAEGCSRKLMKSFPRVLLCRSDSTTSTFVNTDSIKRESPNSEDENQIIDESESEVVLESEIDVKYDPLSFQQFPDSAGTLNVIQVPAPPTSVQQFGNSAGTIRCMEPCTAEFQSDEDLNLHKTEIHGGVYANCEQEPKTKRFLYLCHQCGMPSSNLTVHQSLNNQVRTGTKNGPPKSKANLRPVPWKPIRPKRIPCPHCGILFRTKALLRRHHLSWHADPASWTYKCHLCGTAFPRGETLQKHIRKDHPGNKLLACESCGETFPFKHLYLKHLVTEHPVESSAIPHQTRKPHANNEHFLQDETQGGRAEKAKLDVVKMPQPAARLGDVAHNLRLTPASYENTKAIGGTSLNYQVRTATKNDQTESTANLPPPPPPVPSKLIRLKRIPCPQCGILFRTKALLRRHHLSWHADPASWTYKCHLCATAFPRGETLQKHIRKDHPGNKLLACEFCGETFPFKHLYLKHLVTEHPSGTDTDCESLSLPATVKIENHPLEGEMQEKTEEVGSDVKAEVLILPHLNY